MATTKYSDLLDDVLPTLGADPSDPVTEHAIRQSVIDFCAGSWVWKHVPDPITVTAGESVYDIELPSATDVAVVMAVALDGEPLGVRSVEWLDANMPDWRTTRGTPKYFTQLDMEQMVLALVPESTIPNGLTMTLALQPSRASTGFPGWIANQHIEALADGAISRLMLMPNKPWTDLQTGQDRRMRFSAAMANARAAAVAGLGRAVLRTASQH